MTWMLRNFTTADADGVNQLALSAFDEYRGAYSDWPAFASNIGNMAALAQQGEIIVATSDAHLIGAVAYIGPGKPKAEFFDPAWAVIRMLVVQPESRGQGVGRALTTDCIRRAERDSAPCVALHTTPIMQVALQMYQRMGFVFLKEAPWLFGVPYEVYAKPLRSTAPV